MLSWHHSTCEPLSSSFSYSFSCFTMLLSLAFHYRAFQSYSSSPLELQPLWRYMLIKFQLSCQMLTSPLALTKAWIHTQDRTAAPTLEGLASFVHFSSPPPVITTLLASCPSHPAWTRENVITQTLTVLGPSTKSILSYSVFLKIRLNFLYSLPQWLSR